jgi:hypothetical protein
MHDNQNGWPGIAEVRERSRKKSKLECYRLITTVVPVYDGTSSFQPVSLTTRRQTLTLSDPRRLPTLLIIFLLSPLLFGQQRAAHKPPEALVVVPAASKIERSYGGFWFSEGCDRLKYNVTTPYPGSTADVCEIENPFDNKTPYFANSEPVELPLSKK